MSIARMNERIMIQQNQVNADRYGNHKNSWSDYFSCFAYASTYQYDKETDAAATIDEEQTIKFEVRWCKELEELDSTHYRVIFRSVSYNIVAVDMMNYQKKVIRLSCQREKP